MTGEKDAFKDHFFFPAGKRNGFWNPKKKGLLRVGALWGVLRRPTSLRPHRGPAPAVTACAGGTGKSRGSIPPPPGRWVSRRGSPGGRRPPLRMRRKDGVGAAFGRPVRHHVSLCHSERSEESVTPVFYTTRAQRSGSCCERTSKGAERVFAVRRKQSKADFARTKRRRRIRFPRLCA